MNRQQGSLFVAQFKYGLLQPLRNLFMVYRSALRSSQVKSPFREVNRLHHSNLFWYGIICLRRNSLFLHYTLISLLCTNNKVDNQTMIKISKSNERSICKNIAIFKKSYKIWFQRNKIQSVHHRLVQITKTDRANWNRTYWITKMYRIFWDLGKIVLKGKFNLDEIWKSWGWGSRSVTSIGNKLTLIEMTKITWNNNEIYPERSQIKFGSV